VYLCIADRLRTTESLLTMDYPSRNDIFDLRPYFETQSSGNGYLRPLTRSMLKALKLCVWMRQG